MSDGVEILGTRVSPTSYADATRQILAWADHCESRFVCVANVHVVMEAYDSAAFRAMVNASDLTTPDGMPLVWSLRLLGHPEQERVYGPDLTLHVVEAASKCSTPIAFYGGTSESLEELMALLRKRNPAPPVVYSYSPPFRDLTPEEDERIVGEINESGARILFVGLGCPKQERWMAEHDGRIKAVMIGVGAAFDFHAGRKRQAPRWMQAYGLEWLFRLGQEPRRLWRRYLYHNPRFALLILRQLLFAKR